MKSQVFRSVENIRFHQLLFCHYSTVKLCHANQQPPHISPRLIDLCGIIFVILVLDLKHVYYKLPLDWFLI